METCPQCHRPLEPDVRVDVHRREVIAGGVVAKLTCAEMSIFKKLWDHRGQRVGYEALAEYMGDRYFDAENPPKTIQVHACRIRRKMANIPLQLDTIWGEGLLLDYVKEDEVPIFRVKSQSLRIPMTPQPGGVGWAADDINITRKLKPLIPA